MPVGCVQGGSPTRVSCDCGGSGCGLRLGTAGVHSSSQVGGKKRPLEDGDNLVKVLGCEEGSGLPDSMCLTQQLSEEAS